MSWIAKIEFSELLTYAPHLNLIEDDELSSDFELDKLAKFMVAGGELKVSSSNQSSPDKDKRPDETVWKAVKAEMLEFLCGTKTKYKDLRTRLDSVQESGTHIIVPAIAAVIASHIGVAAGLVTGLVSLILGVMLRTGKNGFCSVYYKA